jgi:hypothetical protein
MPVENAGRLRLELDERTGALVRLRRRPNAFNLLITESPLLDASPRVAAAPAVRRVMGTVDGVGPQRVLELSTRLEFGSGSIVRTVRCPEQHTAQRVDALEFEYEVAGRPDTRPILRVDEIARPDQYERQPIWVLRGLRFEVFVRVTAASETLTVSVAWSRPDGGTAPADIVVGGTGRVRLAVGVTSVETVEREPVLHVLPVPPDLEAVTLTVACPSAFPTPGGRPSRLSWVRPHPLLVFPRDAADPARLGHVTGGRDDEPLRYPPMLDLVRRQHMAVFHGSAPIDDLVRPLFDALRTLPPGRLSTLLAIVWFSPSPVFLRALAALVGSQPLVLARYEPHVPALCDNLLFESDALTLDEKLDVLVAGITRQTSVISGGTAPQWTRDSTASVAIPRDADLPVQIALLGAARLRSGRPQIVPGSELPPSPKPWPEMPAGSPYALSRGIAECLAADILASHVSHESGFEEAAVWPAARQLVRDGKSRLDRLVLVSVGDDDSEALLKSVPAVLYASTPAAPVLAFRVAPSLESEIDTAFRDVLEHSETAAALIATGEPGAAGAWRSMFGSRGAVWDALDGAQRRLQDLLASAIPQEYLAFIERVRPVEIVALTNLPIDWLRVGGTPLGLLTKIAKLRVESSAGRLAALFDLVRAYNGVTETNYQPSPAGFKALCIAPAYDGADQQRVNEIIGITKRSFARRVEQQVELQREIALTTLDGVVTAAQVAEHLRARWDLIVYVGHAAHGRLHLSAGPPFDVSLVENRGFEGATAVLLGCTTEGVADLSGSISNELAALGARGVFAMPARVHLGVMRELQLNLTTNLIALNMTYGDALQQTRRSLLYSYAFLHGAALEEPREDRRARFFEQVASGEIAIMSPADGNIEQFRDGWDDYYRHVLAFIERSNTRGRAASEDIVERAAAVALNVTFMGSLRDRLFIF